MTWTKPAVMLTALALLACVVGCAPHDGNAGSGSGSGQGPLDPTSEAPQILQLRDAALTSANSAYVEANSPLNEDPPTVGGLHGYKGKLHYSAIRHSGYLASIGKAGPITPTPTNLEDVGAYGTYLTNTWLWGFIEECPFAPTRPRWSVDNVEVAPFNRLPSTTNTATPTQNNPRPSTDPDPPGGQPSDPLHRYIVNNWQVQPYHQTSDSDATPSADPAGYTDQDNSSQDPLMEGIPNYDVHEYYLRQPLIPDNTGSRVVTAWQNRYGRMGMVRNRHDRWGFGSIDEARVLDSNVLQQGEGKFLPESLAADAVSDFIGTFAYRVNPNRARYVPSFWPGAPIAAIGNAPITFGWSYDPETGERVGVAIHVAGEAPICALEFGIRYDPYKNAAKDLFQPEIDQSTGNIVAESRLDFQDTNPTPQIFIDDDPTKPLYPINYKVYVSSCAVGVFVAAADPANQIVGEANTTRIPVNHVIVDDFYLPNEAVIVAQLDKAYIKNGLPNGTYRIHCIVYKPPSICVSMSPTFDKTTWDRYFHIWNNGRPNFFRP